MVGPPSLHLFQYLIALSPQAYRPLALSPLNSQPHFRQQILFHQRQLLEFFFDGVNRFALEKMR